METNFGALLEIEPKTLCTRITRPLSLCHAGPLINSQLIFLGKNDQLEANEQFFPLKVDEQNYVSPHIDELHQTKY